MTFYTKDGFCWFRFSLLHFAFEQNDESINLKRNHSRFDNIFNDLYPTKDIQSGQHFGSPTSLYDTDNSDSSSKSPIQIPQIQPINRNIILKSILSMEDTRTTIMLRNIPNRYMTYDLVNILNVQFKGKYDVIYLPIDAKIRKNHGYAFINFNNSIDVYNVCIEFNGKKWGNTNSQKICHINYSKRQGRESLLKGYPRKEMYIINHNKN